MKGKLTVPCLTLHSGQANYGMAKAGVTGFSKVIAKEWGPSYGVRANTYVSRLCEPVFRSC